MHAAFDSMASEPVTTPRFRFLPSIPLQARLPDEPVAIADMANIFGVTHRTLHFYEEKRMLRPQRLGAMRVYGASDIRLMALINLCRETGMAIAQIQDLLAEIEGARSQAEADALLRRALKERKRELVSSQSLIRRQMQQLTQVLDATGQDDGAPDDRTPFLTEFEMACLGLMSEGYTPIRICHATGRDLDDIIATESAIIRKFGSTNRFQAVAKAVLLGIIDG